MTVKAYFGPSYPEWEILHPHYKTEWLGPFLPFFLCVTDPRPAREQFNERCEFGGWQPRPNNPTRLTKNNELAYPGDPTLPPLAKCRLRDETIFLYPGDFVAIVQPDGSFEVARLD